MMLSAADLTSYQTQGFVVVRGLISGAAVTTLQAEVDDLHERCAQHCPPDVGISWEDPQPAAGPRIRQLMNSECCCPTIDDLSYDLRLLGILRQLIGPDVLLFHSKLMMKAAHDGSFTPWHQDWGYWRHGNRVPSQVNCMLAIDDADEENGCIRFVPASHLAGPIDHQAFAASSFNIGLSDQPDAYPDAVPVPLAAGDAVFFGPLVVHGSMPNHSSRHRRANTFAFDQPANRLDGDLPAERMRCGAYRRAFADGAIAGVM